VKLSRAAREAGKYHTHYKIVDTKAHRTTITKLNDAQVRITRFYKNGRIKAIGNYNEMPMELRDQLSGTERAMDYITDKGTKTGIHTWYHRNGERFMSINYIDGVEDMSDIEIYHDNGKIMERGNMEMGKRVGMWTYYTERGKVDWYEHYGEDEGIVSPQVSTVELPK